MHAGPAKKRNSMVIKTRKAESVALATGSILSASQAVAFQFGPRRSKTVFVAYEEVTRGAVDPCLIHAASFVRSSDIISRH